MLFSEIRFNYSAKLVRVLLASFLPVSYTHLTLPTNREV
mgnify:CR=1 FL=1